MRIKHEANKLLRALTRHLRLKVKFVGYLSAGVHGILLPREGLILINAHKPRCEHVYTLLHEIAHFLLHFKRQPKKRHPRFFDIHWKAERLANLCSLVRRYLRFIFNKESGKEWEADLWAMCAFIYFSKLLGCRADLHAFMDRHPEKTNHFLLAASGIAYSGVKTRIKNVWSGVSNAIHKTVASVS